MLAMKKLSPFLWFNDNAEKAAEFYLGVFPHARKVEELRSKRRRSVARGRDRHDHDRA